MASLQQWEVPLDQLSELQIRALRYWQDLKGDREMPEAKEFELMKLPTAALRMTLLVDVLSEGEDFNYRFWGSGFWDYMGYDLTGKTVSGHIMPEAIRPSILSAFRKVYRERREIAMVSKLIRGDSNAIGFQQIIRYPLMSPEGEVSQIFSHIEFLHDQFEAQKFYEEIAVGNI